jgi:SAM-dependent methyltransferase
MTDAATPFEHLVCPRTRQPLSRLAPEAVRALRGSRPADTAEGAGWLSADGEWLYLEQDGVPILLPERAIEVRAGRAGAEPPPVDPARKQWLEWQRALWKPLAEFWQRQPMPIRPAPEDTRLCEDKIREWHAGGDGKPPRVLVLGVTPETVLMRLPAGSRLLAVDFSTSMIRKVWPGNGRADLGVVCGEWSVMPVAAAACDVALADGIFTTCPYPAGYLAIVAELRRVLRPGGLFLVRVFSRKPAGDSVDAIFDDLCAGRCGSLDHFRWRLGVAMQNDITRGVRLGDVWDLWHERIPDPAPLLARLGWPGDAAIVFDQYRGSQARMNFASVDEMRQVLSPGFRLVDCSYPDYELGDRIPTLCFQRERDS